ncbi:MAG: GP88 family protein [Ilumatobacteraceae bacterium]
MTIQAQPVSVELKTQGKPWKYSGAVLSAGADAKTSKGSDFGVLTGICYLSPADSVAQAYANEPERVEAIMEKDPSLSAWIGSESLAKKLARNLCPFASGGCLASCLVTSGNGRYENVQNGRLKKTMLYMLEPEEFMKRAAKDAARIVAKAYELGLSVAFRFDGTSDEVTAFILDNFDQWRALVLAELARIAKRSKVALADLLQVFDAADYYSYTKRPRASWRRRLMMHHDRLHITYSLHEGPKSIDHAREYLKHGHGVAVVMDAATKTQALTLGSWLGAPTIDGDEHDARHLGPDTGHVVALAAKGRAKKDSTGFVVRSL